MSGLEVRRRGSGHPELWLIAGVHGDEVEGMRVVEEALGKLRPARGSIVGVPVAHPAALALGTRWGIDGIDLNRTYPGRPDGGPTERVAHALWEQIEAHRPDAVLTFHSWSRTGTATPYVEHAIGDERGRSLALSLGLGFCEAWDWPAGLLPRELRALGIPAAEIELFGLGCHSDLGLSLGLSACHRAAAWLKITDGPPPAPVPVIEVSRRWLNAPSAGRVVHTVALGDRVAAGTTVAEVHDDTGPASKAVVAPTDGWLAIQVTFGRVEAGEPVAVLFTQRNLPGTVEADPD